MNSDPSNLWNPRLSTAPGVADRTATILVVCQDPDTRLHLKELLHAEGCDPTLVDAYEDVRGFVAAKRPDVIFIELEAASEPMVELCAELRAAESIRDVPIILVSDKPASEELVARGLLAGADDYVVSGERPTELRARLRVQLRNKRYRDALHRVRGEREAFRRQAAVDPLTGLLNRGSLSDMIADKVMSGERFAVLFIDIDHFKSINDRFGHATGDLVLKGVAEYLRDGMRAGDSCGRYGGEEFVVLAGDVSTDRARRLAERHRAAIATLGLGELGYSTAVTVSIGVAVFEPEAGETAEALLERADAALYVAKSSGRNRVVVADEAETTAIRTSGQQPASGFHERFFEGRNRVKGG